ncbi:zinc-binding dehydrogenase [Arthrobacter sp. JZ12]|uniref:quinone oxidoreductase family protein n=1 Tax=Arthrobacter sp. JZ12 TaxID=2654190 RepID=UPI002B47EA80|nr:quinone oxidoreductase [Arthrobacter sp. JZ12]WRH24658.1 zinc-binding dehydrogenase [Arthrobacter sp. JZ12]
MPTAIAASQAGEPEVLAPIPIDRPTPTGSQLLVKVAAVGVNFIETYQRAGIYKVEYPFIPGGEASGEVVDVGPQADGFSVGDRVAFAEGAASYAEFTLIDAAKALPVPDGVDLETAAALPLQGMTAHYLINSTFPVQEGQTVLTHAGAGGTGLLLTQMLKAKGARVITTVSTDEKEELAREAGADVVLRYEGFPEQVRDLTGGTGVDVVFDGVGKATFDGSLASIRERGMLVLFGAASGPVPAFDLQRLNSSGSLYVTRPSLGFYLRSAEERRWRSGDVFGAVVNGSLSVRIGARYPLAEAAQAHTDLQARRTTGKILLIP